MFQGMMKMGTTGKRMAIYEYGVTDEEMELIFNTLKEY